MSKTRYVVGFIFDPSEEMVTLLRKDHPDWQAGKLNGVGGHVEKGEGYRAAMIREGREEAGIVVPWEHFATLSGAGWSMGCFRVTTGLPVQKRNDVGEVFEVHPIRAVTSALIEMIPNLRWLVPMAMETSRHDWPYKVTEKGGESGG